MPNKILTAMAVNSEYYFGVPESVSQVNCNLEALQYEVTLDLEKRIESINEDLRWLEYAFWLVRPLPYGSLDSGTTNPDFWLTDNQLQEIGTRTNNLRPL